MEDARVIELTISEATPRERLDRALAARLPQFSRSQLQRYLREGLVRRNGEIAHQRDTIRTGDVITIEEPPVAKGELQPEEIALDVLFEDEDLLVINKPAGLVVHVGAGNASGTLANALLAYCGSLSRIGGMERPGIVHRLDKETSGCIVVAKNDAAHRSLSQQFASRSVDKIYLALVAGRLRKAGGLIDAAIGRHPVHRKKMAVLPSRGRAAMTEYRLVRQTAAAALVECNLHSGRTHQIRVHMHHIGHPVLGDKTYGARNASQFDRQMLHAWQLRFTHPRTDRRRAFEAPLPDDFSRALKTLGL